MSENNSPNKTASAILNPPAKLLASLIGKTVLHAVLLPGRRIREANLYFRVRRNETAQRPTFLSRVKERKMNFRFSNFPGRELCFLHPRLFESSTVSRITFSP